MFQIDQPFYRKPFSAFLMESGFSETTSRFLADFSVLLIILAITIILYYIAKLVINKILKRVIRRSASRWDDHMYEQRVFTRLAMLLPAIILNIALEPAISDYPETIRMLSLILRIYMVFIMLLTGASFLNAVYHIYGEFEVASSRPIKGYVQIGKIILFVIGGIVILSILVGQSPFSLLAGLGAMSAVLMLVFKDSILGFVAGVQLTSNNMMRIGDWITMPQNNTDGVVIDISLVTVKVRNFDNSVSCIPTYTFISESFQNWRSMEEAGGRRFKLSILMDTGTIKFADDSLIARLKSAGIWSDKMTQEDRRITNLGLFRRFLTAYLADHPDINKESSLVVRQLQPTEFGLPVEMLAFYKPAVFAGFAEFQSELLEYLYAVLPLFGLTQYQRPAGIDRTCST